jgi:hypothetical protein
VLTYVKLKNQQNATEAQLKMVNEIQAAVKEMPKEYFAYDSIYKRFSLVQNIEFEKGKDVINDKDVLYLVNVGNSIRKLIERLKSKYAQEDIKYVVIIEGMASRDSFADNYPLSYMRAWAVQKLWDGRNIMPDQSVCEVQVAGSGIGGIGRYPSNEEIKNQRILIQIVPKIGEVRLE